MSFFFWVGGSETAGISQSINFWWVAVFTGLPAASAPNGSEVDDGGVGGSRSFS